MELQLDMLYTYTDNEISNITGISERTIRDWRKMMNELETAEIRTKPVLRVSSEKEIQSRFVETLNEPYQQYVRTKYGIIDVLTDSTLYEVKVTVKNSTIQRPVGQVLLYSIGMKDINKVIVAKSIVLSDYIREAVNSFGIRLLEFPGTLI